RYGLPTAIPGENGLGRVPSRLYGELCLRRRELMAVCHASEPRRTARTDTATLSVKNTSGNEPPQRYGWNSKIEVRFVCILSLHGFLVELDAGHARDLLAFLREFPLVAVLAQQRRLGVAHDALDGALDAGAGKIAIVETP